MHLDLRLHLMEGVGGEPVVSNYTFLFSLVLSRGWRGWCSHRRLGRRTFLQHHGRFHGDQQPKEEAPGRRYKRGSAQAQTPRPAGGRKRRRRRRHRSRLECPLVFSLHTEGLLFVFFILFSLTTLCKYMCTKTAERFVDVSFFIFFSQTEQTDWVFNKDDSQTAEMLSERALRLRSVEDQKAEGNAQCILVCFIINVEDFPYLLLLFFMNLHKPPEAGAHFTVFSLVHLFSKHLSDKMLYSCFFNTIWWQLFILPMSCLVFCSTKTRPHFHSDLIRFVAGKANRFQPEYLYPTFLERVKHGCTVTGK